MHQDCTKNMMGDLQALLSSCPKIVVQATNMNCLKLQSQFFHNLTGFIHMCLHTHVYIHNTLHTSSHILARTNTDSSVSLYPFLVYLLLLSLAFKLFFVYFMTIFQSKNIWVSLKVIIILEILFLWGWPYIKFRYMAELQSKDQ